MQDFLDVALIAAREAGIIHKKYFNTKLTIKTKDTSFDRVTIADVEAEKKIVEIIRKRFPDHNILGEEDHYEATTSEYQWVIDPLDGTNNFSHGMPIFAVSIALTKGNEVLAGVVYDPMRDELFSARKGHGAFLNGEKMQVADDRSLQEALLITGFYYDRGQSMIDTLEKIKQFFQRDIIGLRRLGAAALDLCYVACGRASGYWEFTLNPWDFAAGLLIVQEAGGRVTRRDGSGVRIEPSFVVASNGYIHDAMLEVLK